MLSVQIQAIYVLTDQQSRSGAGLSRKVRSYMTASWFCQTGLINDKSRENLSVIAGWQRENQKLSFQPLPVILKEKQV